VKPIVIKHGRIIDPSQNLDRKADILLEDGRVRRIAGRIPSRVAKVIDARDLIVAPGLIDMHTHIREPGNEDEETIESAGRAAVAGGFTSIACMPNTEPPLDNEASVFFVRTRARQFGFANIFPVGAITRNLQGESLAEMGQMVRGGAVAFSDDGSPVQDSFLLRKALEYASMLDRTIIEHCEDKSLSAGGLMHEGEVSCRLGLSGIPAASEETAVARDIILAGLTGGRLHIAHLSTRGACELLRHAKKQNLKVTGEVSPHHFSLTHDMLSTYDTNLKTNPPLRTGEDVEALKQALADGTIDVIASDHAPHTSSEKALEFAEAPFGVIGMETLLAVTATVLVEKGVLSWKQVIRKLTVNPAKILGLEKGTLRVGADADVTIIDPALRWTIDVRDFQSRSRNSPFDGWQVTGKAVCTIVGGVVKYSLL